ncbi:MULTISPECIES: GGDEF domain-containing protein [Alphaproteobacteria]|uniref:diguanylate cyclase n=2 Tax=Alphaproteobacteria TaxID=28211 RepID=A0A512HG38_9HYPH|nr:MULTISPECIES: diguanylate cyclase [Alphaproteobacteria]GEO84350.1 hypothetical protein RNA01_12820 [Ciceribacter naphthalenivorans]GLR24887.1 hypothetical protein GCM10007920_46810 [Ciceribacter naphthalenivorans]GLT07743.1 hypothetical protein GCM10007926_46810 [Sphingomonas psychrolutea]
MSIARSMDHWLGLAALPHLTEEQAATYERGHTADRRRILSGLTVTLAALYLLYAAVDTMILPGVVWLSLGLRFGLILPLALVLVRFQAVPSRSIRTQEIATLAVSMAGNLVWCLVLVFSHSPAALDYFYAAVVFQMVVTIALRPSLDLAFKASLATAVINYAFIGFLAGATPGYIAYHLALYVPTFVLTLVAAHQIEAERRRAFLQLHENDTLKRELSRQNDALVRLSATDPLTQLPNRRGTETEITRMRRVLKAHDLHNSAVLMVDIDHFKAFNDSYGHGAGDECLKQVAEAMRRELPATIHLARLGGEEFLAVLPGSEATRTAILAERLRHAVSALAIRHDHTGDRNSHITVSIGAACGSIATDAAFAHLVETADEALYAVKAAGRNGWRFAERHSVLPAKDEAA